MKRDDLALLLLRMAGLGLALHGLPKLLALAAGQTGFVQGVAKLGFPVPIAFAWAAALGECVGGMLVALGLFARVAAGVAGFTMVVAAFLGHHAHGHLLHALRIRRVSEETLKAWGNPEMALLYLSAMAAVALMGAGALSLDALRGGKGRGKR
ncbi:MAG: DoxX family protein [Vicinamibacteria bacterium]